MISKFLFCTNLFLAPLFLWGQKGNDNFNLLEFVYVSKDSKYNVFPDIILYANRMDSIILKPFIVPYDNNDSIRKSYHAFYGLKGTLLTPDSKLVICLPHKLISINNIKSFITHEFTSVIYYDEGFEDLKIVNMNDDDTSEIIRGFPQAAEEKYNRIIFTGITGYKQLYDAQEYFSSN